MTHVSGLFARLASRDPAACVGWRGRDAVTHGAFTQRIRAWTALGRRSPGQHIALYIEDSLEFGAALLGAWQAGKTVWLAADTLPATCTALHGTVDAFWGAYPAAVAAQSPAPDDACTLAWIDPAPSFPALVVHTSGTTGAPRAIAKQLAQLTSELANLETQFGAGMGAAAILATVSHQHIYGLLFRVLWPLQAGRAIHAHAYDRPDTLAAALALGPSVLVASPAYLLRLPAHLDWRDAAGQLRAVFSSGGALAPEEASHVSTVLGQAPVEVYGSSETGGVAWRQGAAAWRALPGVAWRIVDGQLQVLSPHAGLEWCMLADRARPEGAGFVLTGRSDRIVKIAEKRISLDAVDTALCASGLASAARAVLMPEQAGRRQALAVFAVPTPAGQALLDAGGKLALNARLRNVLAGVVAPVALPRQWRYLAALPVNAQGKTTEALLLALL